MKVFVKSLPFTLIAILAFYSMSHAARVNNGAGLQGAYGKMALGVEYDSDSERDTEFDGGTEFDGDATVPFLAPGDRIVGGSLESSRIMLRGSVGLADWMDVFIHLGFADADFSYQLIEAGVPEVISFSGDSDLAYGLGLKAAIANVEGYQIYSNLQLFQSEVDGAYTEDGVLLGTAEATVQEIQLALYAAKTFDMWTPYGGLKFSELAVEIDRSIPGTTFHEEHKVDDNIGLFVGTDVVLKPGLSANIEFRFVDESALSLGLSWVF
ncbi:MAG: hypothetical protein ACE5FZ_09795 [Nitrospiria bacterium]